MVNGHFKQLKLSICIYYFIICPCNVDLTPHFYIENKNSAEVDIAPAFGEITTACNVGQAKNGSWCLLEE